MPYTIRVIGDLYRSLSASAQLSLIDRMRRVAFQLFRQTHFCDTKLTLTDDLRIAFHDSNRHSATRRTQRANAWFPHRDSRHKTIFWNEPDKVVFGIATTGEGRARSCKRGQFYESAAVHINNDKSDNRSMRLSACDN